MILYHKERLAAKHFPFYDFKIIIKNLVKNMSLVLEAGNLKKIKINLDDYAHASDMAHRILLHSANPQDFKVLEEILYSSIKTTYAKLQESTELEPQELDKALNLFKTAGLIKEDIDGLVIDKELRKYFEIEIQRFEEDFEPGLDFMAQILKKVPIHILPVWYALPRTSTNIFESIIEKYLFTPQIYQRLLTETQTHEPRLKIIIDMLFTSDSLQLDIDLIQSKLLISTESLFELISLLEFNLIATCSYTKVEDQFKGYITPFSEFKNYLIHLRETESKTVSDDKIQKITLAPFAFVEGLFALLKCFKNKTYSFPLDRISESELKESLAEENLAYLEFEELMQKLMLVGLIDGKNGKINLNDTSMSFLSMKPESAALVLYRHPLNKPRFELSIPVEKGIRECEKAASRLIGKGWVIFEEFMKGVVTPFSDEQQVTLRKTGRKWQYQLPVYSKPELEFIEHIFNDWFEKVGVIDTGFYANKPSIRLTSLGLEIFS
jgi:hypothetical protein